MINRYKTIMKESLSVFHNRDTRASLGASEDFPEKLLLGWRPTRAAELTKWKEEEAARAKALRQEGTPPVQSTKAGQCGGAQREVKTGKAREVGS